MKKSFLSANDVDFRLIGNFFKFCFSFFSLNSRATRGQKSQFLFFRDPRGQFEGQNTTFHFSLRLYVKTVLCDFDIKVSLVFLSSKKWKIFHTLIIRLAKKEEISIKLYVIVILSLTVREDCTYANHDWMSCQI